MQVSKTGLQSVIRYANAELLIYELSSARPLNASANQHVPNLLDLDPWTGKATSTAPACMA